MKEKITKIMAMLSLLMAVVVAPVGASTPEGVVIDVPFGFSVGNEELPAGRYQIRRVMGRDIFAVRSDNDNKQRATFIAVLGGGLKVNRETTVTFRRYGDRYFLSLIRVRGDNVRFAVAPSKDERKVIKHLARHSSGPEEVMIAAR